MIIVFRTFFFTSLIIEEGYAGVAMCMLGPLSAKCGLARIIQNRGDVTVQSEPHLGHVGAFFGRYTVFYHIWPP